MAMLIGGDSDDTPMAEINVTPLVDVMLVLLIIFMITAPMLHQGVEVALPQTNSAENIPNRIDDPLVLSVMPDGLVYLRDQPVHPSQLVERLLAVLASREDKQVFIKGHRDIRYGDFINIIDLLNQGGVQHVGLVTQQILGR
jgi:biopolymer transport protein TolR